MGGCSSSELTEALFVNAELFQQDKSIISRHIKNIVEEGELDRASVVADRGRTLRNHRRCALRRRRSAAVDGKAYQAEYFKLDVLIGLNPSVFIDDQWDPVRPRWKSVDQHASMPSTLMT